MWCIVKAVSTSTSWSCHAVVQYVCARILHLHLSRYYSGDHITVEEVRDKQTASAHHRCPLEVK